MLSMHDECARSAVPDPIIGPKTHPDIQSALNYRYMLAPRLPLIAALTVLLPLTGCSSDSWFTYAGVYEAFYGEEPPLSASQAVDMAFDANQDNRRRGITSIGAAEYGGEPEYLDSYRLFARDPDPSVRAASAAALGRHGAPPDAIVLSMMLRDEEPVVRWQAADALRKIYNVEAMPALVERLDPETEEDADTRMAAAMALGQYADRVVFSRLVTALEQSDYQVVFASRQSLITLTGVDKGLDPSAWSDWAAATTDLFAKQQAYTYDVYDAQLGWWDKYITFWNNPDYTPQTPEGYKAPAGG